MNNLSIIIVTYNSSNYIRECIDSILKQTKNINYEIVVVDNSSKDNTINIINKNFSKYKNIKVIRTINNGFNAANNIGIRNSESKYIALLNPDTILLNNAFKIIIDEFEKDDNIGIAGGSLYTEDGKSNVSSGSFPSFYDMFIRTWKIRRNNYYYANSKKKKMRVQFPIGADFVFRRKLIDKIGYLDERYFLYFDETDYALSVIKNGYKNYLITGAKIIHFQGKSTENVSEFAKKVYLDSYIKYLKKNVSLFEAKAMTKYKIIELKFKLYIFKFIKKYQERRYSIYLNELLFYNCVYKKLKSNL